MSGSATTSLRALFAGFTQDTRLLRLTTPLGQDVLLAEAVRAVEALDAGFCFDIDALSLDAGIALKRLIGQPALLELLTATPGQALRPFHGHITLAHMSGANGGLARYRLRLEPWTAFLGVGRDSRVFQHMTVCDIVESVLRTWRGKAQLAPAWRFDLLEPGVYPVRSLCTQYQESDLAFVLRLLNEEGLFHYFEHAGDPRAAPFGSHVLVIADHNRTFKANPQAQVRFTQPGAVMREDSLDGWRIDLRERADAVELTSWDYRTRIARPVLACAPGAELTVREAMGQYAWPSRADGERLANIALQALDAQAERHSGAGTVRTLSCGTTFTVNENPQLEPCADDEERSFVALKVAHLMHNNFNAEIRDALRQRLEPGLVEQLLQQELGDGAPASRQRPGERPLYRMRVDALRAGVPYRRGRFDEHGQPRHPKPQVGGQQSAIVVGPSASVIHTDREHRIKLQFHWQRGERSHSRLHHPHPESHTGAPADDTAGTWVRVATPLGAIAGANWGSNALPRVGQEVLVDYMDGDIDRPVVIATLYNGRGAPDAQHSQGKYGAGAATGNVPAWFPGVAGAHAHPAVLSGLKSQAMAASADGNGAYSQLVFDATAGQPRMALQRHAGAHQGTDELNLGQLRHQVDNQRLQPLGFGAELKTAHSLALRAAQGLLLVGGGNGGAGASMLETGAVHAQLEQASQLQSTLAKCAQQQNAIVARNRNTRSEDSGNLPAIEHMRNSATSIASRPAGVSTFGKPQLQLFSQAGIVATSPASAIVSAGSTSSIVAAHDINLIATGSIGHSVKAGIGLFSNGKINNTETPTPDTGMRLHAASGTLSVQSQSAATRLTADNLITVVSVTKAVNVTAKKHLMLTAQGAAIKLEGGNITLQCPGKIEFKAGMKELAGPKSADGTAVSMPIASTIEECPTYQESAAEGGTVAI